MQDLDYYTEEIWTEVPDSPTIQIVTERVQVTDRPVRNDRQIQTTATFVVPDRYEIEPHQHGGLVCFQQAGETLASGEKGFVFMNAWGVNDTHQEGTYRVLYAEATGPDGYQLVSTHEYMSDGYMKMNRATIDGVTTLTWTYTQDERYFPVNLYGCRGSASESVFTPEISCYYQPHMCPENRPWYDESYVIGDRIPETATHWITDLSLETETTQGTYLNGAITITTCPGT